MPSRRQYSEESPTGRHAAPFGQVVSCFPIVAIVTVLLSFSGLIAAQNKYEHRRIDKVEIRFGESELNPASSESYRAIIRDAIGTAYAATKIRDSLQALYNTQKIASVTVAASLNGSDGIDLLYAIKRKPQVEKVSILIGKDIGDVVTEQELRFKLNLLATGTTFTEQTLQNNADQILDYLRTRGFYRSEVKFVQNPMAGDNSVGVTFDVSPNEQAKVESFSIKIDGLKKPLPPDLLLLHPGELYALEKLTKDVEKIRSFLRANEFAAPELNEPRVTYDSDRNTIAIELVGKVGPTVKVTVEAGKDKVSESTMTRLLPVKREGTLDYAAIVEGERRLEGYFQEKGYFFADVTPICSVDPPLNDGDADAIPNNTEFLCSALASAELMGRTVKVVYKTDKNRKLKLVSLRIHGTNLLPIDEVRTVLESQEANVLGVIPLFGYGRGFTSLAILERDAGTIRSLMNELGYSDAQVHVNQGVSPSGDHLIITFEVEEGPPTVVDGVSVTGNIAIANAELLSLLPKLEGENYSRAKIRNAVQKLAEFYSERGYYDARVSSSIIEQTALPTGKTRNIKVEFKIEHEGDRVVINRILVTGNKNTKTNAVLRAAAFRSGDYLRSTDIYLTEQNLYSTDVFDRVDIKPEPAGNTPDGNRATDVIINVSEQPPRLLTYGGGFSTDLGLNGFFDIRHLNLLGNLWQGGARIRWSRRQQLVQFDFINPRFMRDGSKRFAPLTVSLQYQRDSTVTRFFRSAFDKGTFGIVQRVDAKGNPIDQYGDPAGDPTINRLSLSVETSRTLSRKNRTIIFGRYRFEDVRLQKIDSLLIKDLLEPDQRIRLSGPGITFVRDTREHCSVKFSLLDMIAKGEPGDICRYSASDPTRGDYLTAEYNLSLPILGANVGFQKFQASYNFYYTFPVLRNTTFAGRTIIGLAHEFSSGNRYQNSQYPYLDGVLPISERFFAGGSTTLRGFGYEEAGPRVAVVPVGTFFDSKGKQVYLDPFTVPFGGNALVVLNLEARFPISKSIRVVPFYDGGNVYRRIRDIFNPPSFQPNDVAGQNLRALWSHTAGLGVRIKTPIGGEFAVDYGYLINPPRFLIPQTIGPNAIYQLHQSHIHFRFSQAF